MITYKNFQIKGRSIEEDIMKRHNLNFVIASFLTSVYSFFSPDREEYEDAKSFLQELCTDTREYERTIKCLIDRMKI